MSKKLVKLLEDSIDKKFYLERYNKQWQLSENNINIKFKTPNHNSLGFRLDTKTVKDVFSFLGDNPPKDIAKMCDGIIVLEYKKQTYVFLIEQKTKSVNEYKKQLINGWYFCRWLLGLLKEYGHYSDKVKYIGLLCRVRLNADKGTSTHQEPQLESEKYDIKFFKTNNKIIYLQSYIQALP